MVATFLPVAMLKTLIDLSFNTIARYFPLELIFKLIGIELADRSFKKSV